MTGTNRTKLTTAIISISAAIAALAPAGCMMVDEPISFGPGPAPVAIAAPVQQAPVGAGIEHRFTESQPATMGAVQSALMWSEKHDQLSVETEKLREKNRAMFLENSDLKQQSADLQSQLKQTRDELSEANAFLQEMHLELTKWKGDVLGFRDEMRTSQMTQLKALSRILKLLGAEPVESEN